MCTETSYTNIKHSVDQFKFITIEKYDGIQTVLKTVIKVSGHWGDCDRSKIINFDRQNMLMGVVLYMVGKLLRASGYVKLFNTVLK